MAPPDTPGQEPSAQPKQHDPQDEPNPSQGLEYQLADQGQGLGMVELDANGVVGGDDRDEAGCISSRWLLLRVWE